ncbi:protein CLAVATA 3 [Benincasa hispida]|uniref:protein CLAVATA 3 n=1 Tax=Benincasa hispida TaxID=102211 RepID=UPI0019007797|nr:protein CLAVATA 3 [Benincasa hispida]
MALPSSSKFISSFAFFSLLLLIFFLFSSDYYCCWRVARCRCRCVSGKPPVSRALQISRKMLQEMKKEMEEGVDGDKRWWPAGEWEQLRRVPSGPDPLHHNGGSPKKPRTP